MARGNWTQMILDRLIWIIILLVVIFFALTTKDFLTGINFINILLHASVLGVLTIGQAICLMSGNFDLSAEGTLSLVTVLAAWLMLPYREMTLAQAGGIGWQLSPFIVIPIMLILGALVGLVNGLLITRLNMNNFIVTLAMQLILRGIAFVISMGAIMPGTPVAFNWLGAGRIGPLPVSVIVTVLLFIITGVFLNFSRFGRELYAVGANKHAARASGFDPKSIVTKAYIIGGLSAGLAGWMLLGRLQTSVPNLGQGMTLETVAAAVIGGVALSGGSGTIIGAFAGVLLLSVIADGLNLMSVNPFWVDGVRGLIILIALLLEAQKVRIRVHAARASSPGTQPEVIAK